MNNQKKIEDILHSIQQLILEARNEEKDKLEAQEVINLNKVDQFTSQSLETNQNQNDEHLNQLQKVKNLKINPTKNNSYLKDSWKDLSFKKCQEKSPKLVLEKTKKEIYEIEKIFKESLNFWIRQNLPNIVKEETAIYTEKILDEKLK